MAKKLHYGPLIKQTRESLGLTQQEAALKADISQSTFSKLESGTYTLFPSLARKLCKVFPLRYIPPSLDPRTKNKAA